MYTLWSVGNKPKALFGGYHLLTIKIEIMKREEFIRKLDALLDVLTNINNEDLMIHGSDKTEGGMDFFVAKSELYCYNVQFWIGDNVVIKLCKASKDEVLFMFTDYTLSKIKDLSIFVSD